MKSVLLTGATGFLGSHILRMLLKNNYRVVILKRSHSDVSHILSHLQDCVAYNTDEVSIGKIFTEQQIDTIIHTAASYGRQQETLQQIFEANFVFPFELLQYAIENHVRCFINAGTSLSPSVNPYSLSKNQFKEWLFHFRGRISVKNVVIEYFYGPGDSDWKLVTMILKKLADNTPVIEFTHGSQKRDFIYIDDVVNAFECLLKDTGKIDFTEYPLGSGHGISIKQLANACKKISGNQTTEMIFGALASRPEEGAYKACDTGNLEKAGWKCTTSLEDGLRMTYEGLKI